MKDPASAQWRNEVLSADNKTLCGEVNAKNSMGGYVGFKPYIANQKGYLLIRHGLLQSPDAVQLEPVEGLRHLSPSKVYE